MTSLHAVWALDHLYSGGVFKYIRRRVLDFVRRNIIVLAELVPGYKHSMLSRRSRACTEQRGMVSSEMSISKGAALAFGAMLSLCTLAAYNENPYAVGSERLVPGDYRLGGKGVYSRIIVAQSPKLSYDIWRADPHGGFTHLQYTLVSPAKYPVESTEYKVLAPGKRRDNLTVRLYRDDQGKAEPWIVVVRFGDYEQPFGSAGQPLTTKNYSDDRVWVAELRREASSTHFYDSIPLGQRATMIEGIPNCR